MTCETCGGELQRDVAELELRDGARRTIVAQAGWYCWICGAARFTATDLAQAERQFRDNGTAAAGRENIATAKAA